MQDVGYCQLSNLSKDNSAQNTFESKRDGVSEKCEKSLLSTYYEICSMTVMMFSVPV